MLPYFNKFFGNPSSLHKHGTQTKRAVEIATKRIAKLLKVNPKNIFYTSGATESINTAIKGLAEVYPKNHFISVKTEHSAVLNTLSALAKKGYKITLLNVDENGLININELKKALTPQTLAVIVMLVNNETGVIQDIDSVSEICKQYGVYFICDATQAVGKIPVEASKTDILCFSGHKFYAPKGIGGLYVNPGIKLSPLLDGGEQQAIRSGTLNVPGIVAMGKAAQIASQKIPNDLQKAHLIQSWLESKFREFDDFFLNGHPAKRVPYVINCGFLRIQAKELIARLQNIAISTGSACGSGKLSHVLKAMHKNDKELRSSIRISFGRFTSIQEIEYFYYKLSEVLEHISYIAKPHRTRRNAE